MHALVRLQDPIDPDAFRDALAAVSGSATLHQLDATRFGIELDGDADRLLEVLDRIVVQSVSLRGQLTAELVGDPSSFRQEPDGLAFVTDAERSLSGRALSIAAGWAMEGQDGCFYLLPDDGGFTVEGGRLTLWVRESALPGPLARALGARNGRVPLGSTEVGDHAPPAVGAFLEDPAVSPPILFGPRPPGNG